MTTITVTNPKKSTTPTATTARKDLDYKQGELEVRIDTLEKQVAALEAGNQQYLTLNDLVDRLTGATYEKPKVRKTREYTDEERKAIRERLLVGKLAKQKSRETEDSTTTLPDKK